MFTNSELDEAVKAGALSAEDAAAFRQQMADANQAPLVDEEEFHLVTSFNDIFVSLGVIITLVAVGSLAGGIGIAVTCFALATFFTAKRKMALPSIVLTIGFAMGLAWLFGMGRYSMSMEAGAIGGAIGGAVMWWRFRVPIAVATSVGYLCQLVWKWTLFRPGTEWEQKLIPILLSGVAVFAFAMWWDQRDRARLTRKSDVAFWLHLLASPLIVHSALWMSGIAQGSTKPEGAALVIGVYLLLALVALAIDRRAFLVSGLAYVLFAMGVLVWRMSDVAVAIPATALVISSCLLMMSAFWHPLRRRLVGLLPPAVQDRLPIVDRA